jgi:hypothetical protein
VCTLRTCVPYGERMRLSATESRNLKGEVQGEFLSTLGSKPADLRQHKKTRHELIAQACDFQIKLVLS